jgi:hypothetical protein
VDADVKEVSCCALQCVGSAAALLRSFPDAFDKAMQRSHGLGDGYKGSYFTASIVVLSHYLEGGQYIKDYPNLCEAYENAITKLKERGWKYLASFPGAHPEHRDGPYKMEIWGSESFELPKEK